MRGLKRILALLTLHDGSGETYTIVYTYNILYGESIRVFIFINYFCDASTEPFRCFG